MGKKVSLILYKIVLPQSDHTIDLFKEFGYFHRQSTKTVDDTWVFFIIPLEHKHSILFVTQALKASVYEHLCYSFDLVGKDQRFFLYFLYKSKTQNGLFETYNDVLFAHWII